MKGSLNNPLKYLLFASIFSLSACEKSQVSVSEKASRAEALVTTDDAASAVTQMADRYYAFILENTPEVAYFSGVKLPRHDGMEDNSLAAQQVKEALEDEIFSAIEQLDVASLDGKTEWISYAYLAQQLRSNRALRICRQELWNVNQMGGWHSGYVQIAQLQPTVFQ